MRHVGIDVAKNTLAVYIPEEGYFSVTNDKKGFVSILKKLQENDVIGVESTSNYHHKLSFFFIEKGFDVKELNPLLTKQFIRATVRKRKTDKTDSEIISRLIAQGEGHSMTAKNLQNKLKKLSRTKDKLTKMKSSLKLQLRSLKTSILDSKDIKKIFISLIKTFEKKIKTIEEKMLQISSEETKILESIYGISPTIARGVIAEIGDVQRFGNRKKLIAFSGLDPKLTESGSSVYHSGKLTKRGSPFLRNLLYTASFANIKYKNTVFGGYYWKKRKEGKHHNQAMTATSRKMLEIIYALLQKREMFHQISS